MTKRFLLLGIISLTGYVKDVAARAEHRYDFSKILSGDDLNYEKTSCVGWDTIDFYNSGACIIWQCFPTSKIEFRCHENGEFPTTHTTEIVVKHENKIQVFFARRPWEKKVCTDDLREFKKLARGQERICVAGSASMWDISSGGSKELIWYLEKVVSKTGSWSYFLQL